MNRRAGALGPVRALLFPVALAALAGRCNVTTAEEPVDAAPADGGSGSAHPDAETPATRDAGPGSGAFSCGGVICTLGSSGVQSFPCCTDTGECGLRIVLSAKCFARNEKGGVDSRCAPFEIPGQITLPGCCSPSGCGAFASFDGIGCISNPDLGRATVACTPDVPFQ